MMKYFLSFALLVVVAAAAYTQTAARSQVSGTVATVDATANQLTLKSDKGESVTVITSDRTLVLRIPPGETDPKKGAKIALSTLTPGDRAVVVGPSPAGTTWNASAVLVMTRSDVASVQQKDHDDWKKRGTTGTVTALDTANKTRSEERRVGKE